MGFVNLQCNNCKGTGRAKRSLGVGFDFEQFLIIKCPVCLGSGAVIIHTGAIGSNMHIGIDEAGANDETWATLWKVHDDGTLEVKDIGVVEAYRLKE